MTSVAFILASASPARAKVLRSAGINPQIVVPKVDEAAVFSSLEAKGAEPHEFVLALAEKKARAALQMVLRDPAPFFQGTTNGALLVACDSMLEVGGQMQGKPHDPDTAFDRIKTMQGGHGTLWTGHAAFLIPNIESGTVQDADSFVPTQGAEATAIHMGHMSDDEIRAYVATREPLEVAGSFTIDGLGGAFIDSINGDPHSVIGISLPLLRDISKMLGIFWPDLWDRNLPVFGTSHMEPHTDQ